MSSIFFLEDRQKACVVFYLFMIQKNSAKVAKKGLRL